jgi:hypothetical protein
LTFAFCLLPFAFCLLPQTITTVPDIALASISTVSADGVAGWKRELGELATSLGNN